MKYALLLGALASNIILCCSNNFMIMTQHLGVNDHYLEMSQQEEQQHQKDFKRWDTNTKLTTCKKVIDLVSFFVLDETEHLAPYGTVPYSVNNLISRLHLMYNLGDMDAINYTIVKVDVNNDSREVTTQLCIVDPNYQVAIAQGAHKDVYFFLDKTEDMTHFQLTGIAEPKAYIHPLMNYNPKQLKIAFTDSLIKSMEKHESMRSLCPLSEYRKFRLCSLAYIAFMEQNDLKINKKMSYIRVENGRTCIAQAKLLMSAQNESYYITTNLISCTIDTVFATFKFYLVADPHTKGSAYILRKMRKNPPKNLIPLHFTSANNSNGDSSSISVKDFKVILQKRDEVPKSDGPAENTIREKDDNQVESFYYLDMVVEKLTPLMEVDD